MLKTLFVKIGKITLQEIRFQNEIYFIFNNTVSNLKSYKKFFFSYMRLWYINIDQSVFTLYIIWNLIFADK